MSSSSLFFEAPNLKEKYKKLLFGGLLFAALGVAFVVATFMYFDAKGAYEEDAPGGIVHYMPFFLCFIPAYGLKIFMQGMRQRSLLKRTDKKGLFLSEEGIGGSVVLLVGVYSDLYINARRPEFFFSWSTLSEFIVEPVRGSKSYGSPPYYKLTFQDQGDGADESCFILREHFENNEEEIVAFVREHFGQDRVVLNDDICKKQEE